MTKTLVLMVILMAESICSAQSTQPAIKIDPPTFVELPAMEVAGIATFGSPEGGLFAKLWSNFPTVVDHQPGLKASNYCYGVELYPPGFPKKWEWTYLCACPVEDPAKLPQHLVRVPIPAGTFAVFTVPGDDIPQALNNLKQVFGYAYKQWLPNSEYVTSASIDLERYDSKAKTVEILIPVKKK